MSAPTPTEQDVARKLENMRLGEKPPADASAISLKTFVEKENISLAEKSLQQKEKEEIEVQRQDPFSPLHSVKSFDIFNLHPNLLKGVYTMGFNAPSKIQETALPCLLADPPRNLIAQSQSGTGKTAAFVLAMLSRVQLEKKYPQILCLSPTYELAIQTGEVVTKIGQFCPNLKLKYAVRWESIPKNVKLEEHIIIGTPGKVMDWAVKYKNFDLKKINVFVLDEADIMIATQGHQDQCYRIRKHLSDTCQIMFFSATYEDEVMNFAKGIVNDPVLIRLKREEEALESIKQYFTICESVHDKYKAVVNLFSAMTVGQVMIFCHTRKIAYWLAGKLIKEGHAVALLSGELTIDHRMEVLDRFREGKEKVLITTNVLSRGIDIEQVTIVINFDLPVDQKRRADCETYLHRIGRTGRFGKSGIAVNLVSKTESNTVLKQIEKYFGRQIESLDPDDSDQIETLND